MWDVPQLLLATGFENINLRIPAPLSRVISHKLFITQHGGCDWFYYLTWSWRSSFAAFLNCCWRKRELFVCPKSFVEVCWNMNGCPNNQAITTRKADNVLKKTLILNKRKKRLTDFVLSNFLGQVKKSVAVLLLFSFVNVILGVKHLFSALIMAWFPIILWNCMLV